MNNRQFNQLNAAYLRALERYNRGLNSPAARIQNRRAAAANSGTANVATGTATNVDGTPTASTSGAATATTNDGPAAAPRTITNSPAPTSIEEQQRLARLQQLQDQFRNDFNTSLDATFTDPAMRQRFNQLNLQSQGLGAFNDPAIQQQLNLSAQQRQQLAALNAQWRRDLMNLQRGNRNNLTQAEFDALRAQYAARLNAILTVQQQQSWGQLVGQPFNFPFTIFLPPTEPVVDRRGDSPTTNQAPAPSSALRSPQTQTVR
jgi:hypothetical protein